MSRLLILGLLITLLVTISYAWATGVSGAWANESSSSIEVGQAKAPFCARCHGASGISKNPGVPNLAGQQKVYIIKQLKDFRSGFRRSAPMREVARSLSHNEIVGLATYYNSLGHTK